MERKGTPKPREAAVRLHPRKTDKPGYKQCSEETRHERELIQWDAFEKLVQTNKGTANNYCAHVRNRETERHDKYRGRYQTTHEKGEDEGIKCGEIHDFTDPPRLFFILFSRLFLVSVGTDLTSQR